MSDDATAAKPAAPDPAPEPPPEQTGARPPSYGVLLKDVEGLGDAGRVFASPTKVGLQRMVDAGDARAVSDDEVEMARPFILKLEP